MKQDLPAIQSEQSFSLLAHCTEKTALPATENQWKQIYAKAGLELKAVSVGCCGMAGTYGHEAQNFDNSKTLYEMSWQQPVQNTGADQVLVTGFSCRSQVKRLEGVKPKHPLQQLLTLL